MTEKVLKPVFAVENKMKEKKFKTPKTRTVP